MCTPTWPLKIGKRAFFDYAREVHGWTPERAHVAWEWVVARQAKVDADEAERNRQNQKIAEGYPHYIRPLPAPPAKCACKCCCGAKA